MKIISEDLQEIKLVGIKVRTNNEAESKAETCKIGLTMQKFFLENLQDKIKNKKSDGKVFSVYTDYSTDSTGEYTYFIGEEVSSFDDVDKDLQTLTIPAQKYSKFTSDAGHFPEVVINLWHEIWAMDSEKLGGERSFVADFEVYDERCSNQDNAIADIFIGIKK